MFETAIKHMQQLVVKFADIPANAAIADVSRYLDSSIRHEIQFTPWASHPYRPEAGFAIAYTAESILLKYFVKEQFVRARSQEINSAVWEDSCVEFFVRFDNRGYYNLEFNCEGTAFAGFGQDRVDRHLLPGSIIESIDNFSAIHPLSDGQTEWELTLNIPLSLFIHHSPGSLNGRQYRGNFYKCGDLLPIPHYLSWSPIDCPMPDFHQPSFFGALNFE